MSSSFPLNGLRVRFAGETDTGKRRSHNEDYLYLPESERVVIVADGMGGHSSGDVASRMAVEAITEHLLATANTAPVTWPFRYDSEHKRDYNRLITAIKLSNLRIFEKAQHDGGARGMGTTVVAALFADDLIHLAHVGDSRIYQVRDSQLAQLTEDHSLLNDYIKMQRLSAQQIDDFPHKNVIVRALGMKDTIAVDMITQQPKRGDLYLLCSDGLSGMVPDELLLEHAQAEPDLDRLAERLIDAANQAGGVDNITVALARIE